MTASLGRLLGVIQMTGRNRDSGSPSCVPEEQRLLLILAGPLIRKLAQTDRATYLSSHRKGETERALRAKSPVLRSPLHLCSLLGVGAQPGTAPWRAFFSQPEG